MHLCGDGGAGASGVGPRSRLSYHRREKTSSTSLTASALTHRYGPASARRNSRPPPIPKPASPIRSPRTNSAPPITRWSGNTARMSIRRRISPRTASPWTDSAQADDFAAGRPRRYALSRQGPEPRLLVADLKPGRREHGRVPEGAFAALRTDMYKDWDSDPERFKRQPFPDLAFDTIKFLTRSAACSDRARIHGHRHHRQDEFRDLDPAARPLSDRGHGQSRQGAPDRRADRRDLAEGESGLGFPARAFAILP